MDGGVSDSFTILPDQMQVVNAVMVLGLIPLFDRVIYPVLGKFGLLKKPLQRMVLGLFLTATAFVVSALVEMKLQVKINSYL